MRNITISDLNTMLQKAKIETCSNTIGNRKYIITNTYEGIPETLILNVIGFVTLLICFTFLRRKAWDYGRLALVNNSRNGRHWTQFFYAHPQENEQQHQNQQHNILMNNSISSNNNPESTPTTPTNVTPPSDTGPFSWIMITLRLTKEQFLMNSGPDAVHYLSFQRHLMCVLAVITVISLTVVLPINFQGELQGNKTTFGHTTLPNLDPDTPLLWVHVLLAIGYAPLVVLIMRRSSGRYAFKIAPTRSIMITNIAARDRNKSIIRNYMQELFPDVKIEDVQLAYNVTKLMAKNEEYERAVEARMYCENHPNRSSITVRPKFCSCKRVPAYEFYQAEENCLEGEVARLRASALNEPLGIAFVTVSTVVEAQNIVSHFRPGTYRQWNLKFAPLPSDIYWENLSVSTSRWYVKWVIVNIALFMVLFFLTTPAIILTLLDSWKILSRTKDTINKLSPIISEFIPTLMLWTLSVVLPLIVAYSERWLSHWTRSLQNYSTMTKTFGYLLLMILILPSLGLSSVEAMLEWSVSENNTSRWECFFLSDKGAFFVNYVITSAFIGISLELIRFPVLLVYIWHLLLARSRAEIPYIRRYIYTEFDFGVQYAWTLLVFTMTFVYSIPCPLIAPFGMLYLCLKHFVDRYNLYFTYKGTNMISQNGGKIHSTAVTMTKFSICILITVLTVFTTIREGLSARASVLIFSLCSILSLFIFMSPIKRCTTKRPIISDSMSPMPLYYPDILRGKIAGTGSGTSPLGSHQKRSYGTDSNEQQQQQQSSYTNISNNPQCYGNGEGDNVRRQGDNNEHCIIEI